MTAMDDLRHFDDVDAAQDQLAFVDFLDRVDALPDVAAYRARSYKPFGATGCVVDVGCGTGTAARELANRVERVVGVDASEAMIEVARKRSGGRPDVRFEVGDALALPFRDATVDGYRAERLFQHLANPAAALSEARRVLRPGGRIAIIDQDWDTLIFATDDIETTRRVSAGDGRLYCRWDRRAEPRGAARRGRLHGGRRERGRHGQS
jgi:SAM-dependent methyltransferase